MYTLHITTYIHKTKMFLYCYCCANMNYFLVVYFNFSESFVTLQDMQERISNLQLYCDICTTPLYNKTNNLIQL